MPGLWPLRQFDFCEDRIEIRQHIFYVTVPIEVDGRCLQQFIQTVCNVSESRCRQIHLSSPEAVFIGQKEEVDTYVGFAHLCPPRFLRNGVYQEPFGI